MYRILLQLNDSYGVPSSIDSLHLLLLWNAGAAWTVQFATVTLDLLGQQHFT